MVLSKLVRLVTKAENVSRKYNDVLAAAAGLFLTGLMLLTVVDVTGRYVFNRPIQGAFEISQQMMALVVFPVLAYTLITEGHVRVTLLLGRIHGRLRLGLEILSAIFGILLFAAFAPAAWVMFWSSWQVNELMPAAVRMPYWPSKLGQFIGTFVMFGQFIIYLISYAAKSRSPGQQVRND